MRTNFCFLFALLGIISVHATSKDYSQILERVYVAEHNGNVEYCIDAANSVYNDNQSKNFSEDELYILASGARGYCFYKDTVHAELFGRYPIQRFLQKYDNSFESSLKYMSEDDRRNAIVRFSFEYHRFQKLLNIIEPQQSVTYAERHHKLITSSRLLFMSGTNENDVIDYLLCLTIDNIWIHAHRKADVVLEIYFPIMVQALTQYKSSIKVPKFVLITMEEYLPYVLNHAFFSDTFSSYADQITNYVLTYQELQLWARRASSFKNNNSFISVNEPVYSIEEVLSSVHNEAEQFQPQFVDWRTIKESLREDEIAVVLYSFEFPYNSKFYKGSYSEGICFDRHSVKPQKVVTAKKTGENTYETILLNGRKTGKALVCHIDGTEEERDYYLVRNWDMYRKYSLYDIVRERATNSRSHKYEDGTILLCASIDYGQGIGKEEPLVDGERLITTMQEKFPDNAYVLSGKNVKKVNFLNIVEDVQILHISTHGEVDSTYLIGANSDFGRAAFDNEGNDTYLCLSRYNEDPTRYRITASEIQDKITLGNNCLVFLDACNTNNTRKTYYGSNSLAKAFYIAGARYIIAYLNPVNEKVATDFAISFYKKIADNPNITYHDAFYQTKKEIFQKYKDTGLINNKKGVPTLDVVLWE